MPNVEIRPGSPSGINEDPDHRAVGGVRLLTVSDVHQSAKLYTQLAETIERHRPDVLALVGDFLDVPGLGSGMLSVRACADSIAKLPVPEIAIVRGNHEDRSNWMPFEDSFVSTGRALRTLHGESIAFGPLTMIGFPCGLGDETLFTLTKRPLPPHCNGWLPDLMRKLGPPGRTAWLMHEPSSGTYGCREWFDAIGRFQPLLVVSGHDHKSALKSGKWYHRVGQTVCMNTGQSDGERLHYALIEMEFASSKPSLPRRMTVRAFPWNQAIELPER